MGKRLGISDAHVAYLDAGKRSPRALVTARWREFTPRLPLKFDSTRALGQNLPS